MYCFCMLKLNRILAYVFVKIEFQKAKDVILTSGEYLETDKTPIDINSFNADSYNLISFTYMK